MSDRGRRGNKTRDGGVGVVLQSGGAEEERKAQWWANCSAVTQAGAYVEFNMKKQQSLEETHKKIIASSHMMVFDEYIWRNNKIRKCRFMHDLYTRTQNLCP